MQMKRASKLGLGRACKAFRFEWHSVQNLQYVALRLKWYYEQNLQYVALAGFVQSAT